MADLATERQLKAIYAWGRSLGLTDNQTAKWSRAAFGVVPEALPRQAASEFIDQLRQAEKPYVEPDAPARHG